MLEIDPYEQEEYMLSQEVLLGLMLPLAGTTAGSACVFFVKRGLRMQVQKALAGFASGVMMAASIWSLLIPALEQANAMGRLAFLPAVVLHNIPEGMAINANLKVSHF